MSTLTRLVAAVSVLLLIVASGTAFAQASIAGVVRDSSGGVLPGVTVEASSPALIEKTRSVVTDGTGQYRIVDLRPGVYTVAFTLTGFNVVKREGIELAGTFTASVNADMKVGALEETVVVTGETPVVDVRSVAQERAMGKEIVDAIPTSRLFMTVGVLIPGMNLGAQDVGGVQGDTMADLTIHGTRTSEERLYVDGMSIGHPRRSGSQASGLTPNMGSTEEVSVKYAGGMGEAESGGPRINMVPKEGGNKFSVSTFLSGTGSRLQSNNYTQELRDRGLSTPNEMKRLWDINPSVGGPIRKDKLWFYSSFRHLKADNYPAGIFPNVNANNPNSWTYVPDTTYATAPRPVDDQLWQSLNLRLTWQATTKNKISVFSDDQVRCRCHAGIGALTSPEATTNTVFGGKKTINRLWQGTWTSPLTNRLLLEAGATTAPLVDWGPKELPDRDPALYRSMIRVTEQSLGAFNYRAPATVFHHNDYTFNVRASVTYVTGTHNFKVGYVDQWAKNETNNVIPNGTDLFYQFANGFVPNPVPNQFTMNALPAVSINVFNVWGLYAQDSWTVKRLTLSGGVRFDAFTTKFPQQQIGPGRFVPVPVVFQEFKGVDFKDVTPRMGAAYDLFGNGKTAVKANLGNYMVPQDGGAQLGGPLNPILRTGTTTNRAWNDSFYPVGDPRRGNYVPDCDLLNPLQNAECGTMSNRNFAPLATGQRVPFGTTYDPAILSGWGVRADVWEFSTGVQQELMPRVSLDVTYTRRWYGNFTVTDNLAVGPADFDPFSIIAPRDDRLPGGGGYQITDLWDVKEAKFGVPNNLITSAKKFGTQIERFNGLDMSLNARPRRGLLFNGGISYGRTVTDNCDVAPKIDNPSKLYCRVVPQWKPQVKLLGAYTVPKVDVQVSATFQSVPQVTVSFVEGINLNGLAANYNATNADIRPTLGRNLAGGRANTTVNILEPATLYGPRLNQLDFRIGKLLKFGRWRSTVNVEVFNTTNSNVPTSWNSTFNPANPTVWLRPNAILAARFAKISAQINF